MKQKIEKLFILFTVVLISFSCGDKKFEFPEPLKNSSDGSFVIIKSTFKFGGRVYAADYGIVTVPENRNKVATRLIHLPFIRIHARIKNIREPVFGLAGGPGQSNMHWSPIDSLLFNHDFVMVGYRGVDGSTVLNCPEVARAMKSGSNDILKEESIKKIARAWITAANRLESEGIDLNGYTIPETVEDMEAVRKALKYGMINLLSESYGTRIAYIYGVMHPEKICRSVMIAMNPPGRFIWDAGKTDEQMRYYSELWARDSAMKKESGNLYKTMGNVLSRMPHKWLFFPINPGKVKAVTFALLFHRKTAALVFDSYAAAEKGDYSGLVLMSLAFDYTLPSMTVFGDLGCKAVSADLSYYKRLRESKVKRLFILGSPMNDLLWKSLDYCDFPVNEIPADLQKPEKSDVETLILSGSVDFSTPPEYAKDMLRYLNNGKQIIFSEYGHVNDLRYLNQKVTENIIADYFNKGTADVTGIKYIPMNFKVAWGFPFIAKACLAAIAFILIVLIWAIFLLEKKIINSLRNIYGRSGK